MLENNVFSVNQMLFNLRYCFNANEQARRYLLRSDVHVQVSQICADLAQFTVVNI